jgi:membrane-bound lytic murein transglycosylase A
VLACCTVLLPWTAGCEKPDELAPWQPPDVRKDYGRPLPPGAIGLRQLDPSEYPDFGRGFYNAAGLAEAVRHSLGFLAKPSSRRYYPHQVLERDGGSPDERSLAGAGRGDAVAASDARPRGGAPNAVGQTWLPGQVEGYHVAGVTHDRAVASLKRFLEIIPTVSSPEALNEAIRREFDVYGSVGWDGSGVVYFTGYYCPIFDGRRQRDERFRYPLYALPDDLVKDAEGTTLGRRMPDGSTSPKYHTRRDIDTRRPLQGREIAWVDDPFKAYVITVQGSAKLRLADGSLYEIGYAGNNGYTYTPVGLKLVADGQIARDELSLQAMLAYFSQHPDRIDPYCHQNDRYVFFKETQGGPFGSINVPVIPFRSVATDKDVFPRACLTFVDTAVPSRAGDGRIAQASYGSFALDQDTGGAIRAAGRCDIYMGEGDSAEALAGRTGAEGRLYYLFLKN